MLLPTNAITSRCMVSIEIYMCVPVAAGRLQTVFFADLDLGRTIIASGSVVECWICNHHSNNNN